MSDWEPIWAFEQRVTGTVIVACLTLVTYDYLLTVKQEIRYVWRAPWTPGTLIFLLLRYMAFMDLPILLWEYVTTEPGGRSCQVGVAWIMWMELIALLLSCLVIGLRTWAIWDRSRACGLLVGSVFLAATGMGIYATFTFNNELSILVSDFDVAGPGCIDTSALDAVLDLEHLYELLAVYESLVLALTLWRGFHHLRQGRTLLISVLYRDAFLASSVLCCTSVVIVAVANGLPTTNYWFTCAYIHRAFTNVLPSRIILNIREATYSLDGWDITIEDSRPVVLTMAPHTATGSSSDVA